MNQIADLKAGQGKIEVEGKITSMSEPRFISSKDGRELKVVDAVIQDSSGSIGLTLWNEQADNVKVGDLVKISNGYVNEFRGEKKLGTGKFGKLEVVSAGGALAGGESEEEKKDKSKEIAHEEKAEEKEKEPAKSKYGQEELEEGEEKDLMSDEGIKDIGEGEEVPEEY